MRTKRRWPLRQLKMLPVSLWRIPSNPEATASFLLSSAAWTHRPDSDRAPAAAIPGNGSGMKGGNCGRHCTADVSSAMRWVSQ